MRPAVNVSANSTPQRSVSNTTASAPTSTLDSATLLPKRTTPRGEMQNSGCGQFYKNYDNSLETGVAYKYASNPKVYVYDGRFMRSIDTERAFLDFYSCGNIPRIIDCAPIYEMPSIVTPAMFQANSQVNKGNNPPTVRQMQQDIDKEIKKMVDEANR